jgi:D-glycero-alpha-D-manno-heptose-7-phosphate kinase
MSRTQTITCAPTRIDLAGGTLDIWPLNLFFDSAVTVNMAVSITVKATVTGREDGRIVLESKDQKTRVEFDNAEAIHHNHRLGLLSRIAEKFVRDGRGYSALTESSAPAGAGLAGSSALNVALCVAFSETTKQKLAIREIIEVAKDIEAAHLRIPTGLQDYGAAVYGGVNAFHFPPGGMERERLDGAAQWLSENVALFYSGASRSSGINNWEMFKRVTENHKPTVAKFAQIAKLALLAREALSEKDYASFTSTVDAEWKTRKALFPEISTPLIDCAITAGKKAGARSARICGAGGGGCFFLIAGPKEREKVIVAVTTQGARHLPFRVSRQGVVVYNSHNGVWESPYAGKNTTRPR